MYPACIARNFTLSLKFSLSMIVTHRNSRTRTLAASRDIADLWRSKMVPTKRQNNGGIADQLTRTNYWLDRAQYLSIKFGSITWQMD